MNINTHLQIIIKKYNLQHLYFKFILLSITTSTVREGFYWLLIYFNELIKTKPHLINLCGLILIILLIINIPIERYFNHIKATLIEKLNQSNSLYFYDRISKLEKFDILTFNLVEFNNIIEHLNENIEQYIHNIKIKYDIPLRFISLLVIAFNKELNLLIGLFFIYFSIVKVLNEWKLIDESKLNDEYFTYENIIRNYIINGKTLLINNEFNLEYLTKNITKYQSINKNINEINNKLDVKINIVILMYILIILKYNKENFNIEDFFYYFLIIYDIEYIGDKVTEYYKNKIHLNKMKKRLTFLYQYKPCLNLINYKNINITKIKIKVIKNIKPKLNILNITIKAKDHILISGISGSGKTSLLYVLKGIIKPDILEIEPNIDYIISQSYLTLTDHKNLTSDYLFDIISNYEENPNLKLIQKCLNISKFNKTTNILININLLSSGEKIRLFITRLIYTVIKNNYKILLFDEIDENLNDELAIDICKNIRNIFANKIILYISHNEKVKNLFNLKINIDNGSNI
jgi:ABC-type lipoprotein export system ATPase subunit